jgi:hypothetical protein
LAYHNSNIVKNATCVAMLRCLQKNYSLNIYFLCRVAIFMQTPCLA